MTSLAMTELRLRIAMFTDSYLPRISGVVHSVRDTAHALRAQGHLVMIAAPRYPGYAETDADVVRFPSIRPPRQPDFPLAVPLSRGAWQRMRAFGADVVHTHTPFLMGAAAARMARRARGPLVFTHHTLYDEYVHYAPFGTRRVSAPAVRAYVTAYANHCQAVIVPAGIIEQRLRRQGVIARIERIPTGAMDPTLLTLLRPGGVRAAHGIPSGRPLLVTASRLAREKSVDTVLRAFALLRAMREMSLLVVGGGPEEKNLRALAGRLGITPDVAFAGLLPHQRALECIAAGDLFVFGSQTETQAVVVFEAMALGLPVVAVEGGGIADVVRHGETGYLVPPHPEALAAQIGALLDDAPRRAAMSAAGKEAAQAFMLPRVTAQLIALYESLVPVRRAAGRTAH